MIEYTLLHPGDANGDGQVNGLDYIVWSENFNDDPANDPPGPPANGDFNGDGKVSGLDYLVWAANFHQGPNDVRPVPEPGSLFLMLCGCVAALAIDRFRRVPG